MAEGGTEVFVVNDSEGSGLGRWRLTSVRIGRK